MSKASFTRVFTMLIAAKMIRSSDGFWSTCWSDLITQTEAAPTTTLHFVDEIGPTAVIG